MKRQSTALLCGLLVLVCARGGAAQMTMSPGPAASAALPRLAITPQLLADISRRTVTVTEENGASATYSGVDLSTLLAKNGVPAGHALHGPASADYVVVRAADGYRTVFALAELDPAVTDKIVLLADQRNGAPLGPDLGPFRIVVPDEKRHLRWIHNVIEIDVLAVP